MTPESRADLVEADAKQLLWIALQLRFFLPFKSTASVMGVMTRQEDGEWDVTDTVYCLAGTMFDRVLDEAAATRGAGRRRLTVKDVREIAEDLFVVRHHDQAPTMVLAAPSIEVVSPLRTFLEALSRGHKDLKQLLRRELRAGLHHAESKLGHLGYDAAWAEILEGAAPFLTALGSLEAELGSMHSARVEQARLCLLTEKSLASAQLTRAAADIAGGYSLAVQQATAMYGRMMTAIDVLVEARKWAWVSFVPIVGPCIKAVCHLVAGDLEGFVASAWDPLSVFPVVQGVNLVVVGVHTVDHSVHRRAGAALGGAIGCDCAFAVRGAVGGVDCAAARCLMAPFGGEFVWIGQLGALKQALRKNGRVDWYLMAGAVQGLHSDALVGHQALLKRQLQQRRDEAVRLRVIRHNKPS